MLVLALLGGCLFDTQPYDERVKVLTDEDGDSFSMTEDCDDGNAAVFPGATEVCDGLDQDCDGAVDEDAVDATRWYADEDLDRYGDADDPGVEACEAPPNSAANALDCDDTSPQVSPAVAEVPYDGVDNDCDGGDLTDVDRDGFTATQAGGDDCDDEDAEVNPSVVEVPYDGVDQDCSGGDVVDVDGDGVAAAEAGGDDCDDTDPTIYVGAAETWANGFTDNDCDGEAEAATLEYGSAAWAGWREGDWLGRRIEALGDIDGDGLQDVLIGSEYDTTLGAGSGAVYAIDGAPAGSLVTARSLLPNVSGLEFANDVDAGTDATGDGVPDVVVNTVGSAEVVGTAWLVSGAAWASQGNTTVEEVAVAMVNGSAPGTYGPTNVRFVGDVTGDGVTDIALSECCGTSTDMSTNGRVAFFSATDFAGTIEDADVLITGPWEGTNIGGAMDPVGDQDGDGLDEIVVSGIEGFAAAVVGARESGRLDDLAITLIYAGDFPTYTNARDAGDLDGDGRRDVAIVGGDENGYIQIFTALSASPTRLLTEPTSVIEWSTPGTAPDIVQLGDLDGDSRDELLVTKLTNGSGDQHVWVVEGADVTVGGRVPAEESRLAAISVVPMAGFGSAAALAGDVDGDGQDDIVLGAPNYSAGAPGAGGATLIPVPR